MSLNFVNLILLSFFIIVMTKKIRFLFFAEKRWVLEWIRIRVGYVWTDKFDLNVNTCGCGNFSIRKEKVPNSKMCGRSLNLFVSAAAPGLGHRKWIRII